MSDCAHDWEHQPAYSGQTKGSARRFQCRPCGIWGWCTVQNHIVFGLKASIQPYAGPVREPRPDWAAYKKTEEQFRSLGGRDGRGHGPDRDEPDEVA